VNWNAKLKGALLGEMDGADVAARVAGAYPLVELRRQLADQRLDAELAHPGEEWRLTDDLATLESPLWQAEALLALTQSLVEAEQEAHPDRPTMMSPASHDEALMLLGPLDTILAQVSTGLADPARRPTLSGVNLITPTGLGRYQNLAPAYLKGVQRGAERLEGMVQTAISDLSALVGRSGGPDWIANGIRAFAADLAGARTTLQALGIRVSAPGGTQGGEAATVQLARELWQVVNAYLRVGQLVAAPRLMPGAAPLQAPAPAWTPPPPRQQWSPPAQPEWNPPQQNWNQPPQPWNQPPQTWNPPPQQWEPPQQNWTPEQTWTPPEEPPRAMPEIVPTWEPPPAQEWTAPAVETSARPLPDIAVGWHPPEPTPPPPPAVVDEKPRPLPQIGTAPRAAEKAPTTLSPVTSGLPATHKDKDAPRSPVHPIEEARSLPRIGAEPSQGASTPMGPVAKARQADDAPRPLPQIGAEPTPALTTATGPARPVPSATPTPGPPAAAQTKGDGRKIARAERWLLSSTTARRAMRARGEEERAEHDLAAFWDAKGWTLSRQDQAYLDAVTTLTAGGSLAPAGRSLPAAPFPPIHAVTGRGATMLDQTLPAGALLAFDFVRGRLLRLEAKDGVPD
jgi:hypothetical protein